ncbi:MAG: ribonuclease H-like domain-containing protein [Hyphomonadaceae bacterium]|nr:ribonuclease H-like domain-containing protein [Clostridia bacterium]
MIIRHQQIPIACIDETVCLHEGTVYPNAIFLDLEHCIFKVPICIGVFGICEYREGHLFTTQYMIENRQDSLDLLIIMRDYFATDLHGYMVTFAGGNDLSVIRYLFEKNKLEKEVLDHYICVDLQKVYHAYTKENTGLKPLEKLFGIAREEEDLISGSALARTFYKMMDDEQYSQRMPKEKIELILNYNLSDVINMFYIVTQWHRYVSRKEEETP